jgi:hypothetical protein
METDRNLRGKKVYHHPKVIRYGDIRDLTQNVGPTGRLDGSSEPNMTGTMT